MANVCFRFPINAGSTAVNAIDILTPIHPAA